MKLLITIICIVLTGLVCALWQSDCNKLKASLENKDKIIEILTKQISIMSKETHSIVTQNVDLTSVESKLDDIIKHRKDLQEVKDQYEKKIEELGDIAERNLERAKYLGHLAESMGMINALDQKQHDLEGVKKDYSCLLIHHEFFCDDVIRAFRENFTDEESWRKFPFVMRFLHLHLGGLKPPIQDPPLDVMRMLSERSNGF